MQTRKIEDLLKNIDGFSVTEGGQITYRGKEVKALLMDGDDLLGRDYGIITKNLSAEAVDKVQVFENYHTNRLIAKVSHTKDVAVNLKLKSEFKGRFSGNASGSHALSRRYEAESSVLFFNKKIKYLQFLNGNNISKSNAVKIFSFNADELANTSIDNLFLKESRSQSILATSSVTKPSLDDIYTQNNKDYLAAPILHVKFNEKLKGALQLNYLCQSEKFRENSLIHTIIDESTSWNTRKESEYRSFSHSYSGSVYFEYDNKKSFTGDLKVQFSIPQQETKFVEMSSLSFIDTSRENLRLKRINLGLDYTAVFQTGNHTVLNFNAAIFSKDEDVNMTLHTQKFRDYFENGPYQSQNSLVNNQIYKSNLQFLSRFNKYSIKYGLYSEGNITDTRIDQIGPEGKHFKSLRSNEFHLIGLQFAAFRETKNKIEYGVKLNHGLGSLETANLLSRKASVYKHLGVLNYKMGAFASASLEIGIARQLPSLNYFYIDSVISTGTVFLAADSIVPITYREVNLGLTRNNVMKNSSITANLWFKEHGRNYRPEVFFTKQMTELKYSPVDNDREFGAMINGKSFIYFIKSTMSGGLHYRNSSGNKFVNDKMITDQTDSWNLNFTYVSSFKSSLKFEIGYNATLVNISQFLHGKRYFHYEVFAYQANGIIKWLIKENMYVAGEYKLWVNHTNNSFQALGLQGTILWSKRLSSDLKVHNLLNYKTFEQRVIGSSFIGETQFDVIPRYVLFSLNWNF